MEQTPLVLESEHPIDEAARLYGGREALAKALQVTVGALGNWKARGVPYLACVQIESLVPSVTRKRLRPRDYQEMWPELRDSAVDLDSLSPAVEVGESANG